MQMTNLEGFPKKTKEIKTEIAKRISGMDRTIEAILVCMTARGHVLLEGMPGLAKTRLARCFAEILNADFHRIQFTPDLLPADLIGTNIFSPKTGEFSIRKGPIFTNILLADEINRAPAKVQSALLQCMEEGQVTIGDSTFDLTSPFFVLATQNPIDQEGTYNLPEAQMDRFLMKVKIPYPSSKEESSILKEHGKVSFQHNNLESILNKIEMTAWAEAIDTVFIEDKLIDYIVSLVRNTRPEFTGSKDLKTYIAHGGSPRASLAFLKIAKSVAILEGRDFVIPEDIKKFAVEILSHRILKSVDAFSESITEMDLVHRVLEITPVP